MGSEMAKQTTGAVSTKFLMVGQKPSERWQQDAEGIHEHNRLKERGRWRVYFGADCPICSALTPVLHDPSRGKANIKLQGEGSKISTVCPKGHEILFPLRRCTALSGNQRRDIERSARHGDYDALRIFD
jgi:hypothetical protein